MRHRQFISFEIAVGGDGDDRDRPNMNRPDMNRPDWQPPYYGNSLIIAAFSRFA